MSRILSKGATGKILYSIAWEKYENGKIIPQLDYTHATDAGDAWKQFYASVGAVHCKKIIGIAPAVGFHVHDKHGDKLSL